MLRKKILAALLAFALLFTIMPASLFGAGADNVLEFRGAAESVKIAGDVLYGDGDLTLRKADPSMYDLTGPRRLPAEGMDASSMSASGMPMDGVSGEELTYVETYAEMLVNPVGIVDIEGTESQFVFVWLQNLPDALERVYERGVGERGLRRNLRYEEAREKGRAARGEIKSRHSRGITYEYSVVFSGFAMEATMAELQQIASMDGVFAITEVKYDELHYIPDPDYTTLGNAGARELMEIGDLHAAGIDGRGIKVGVIDSGIQTDHPDLKDAYKGGYNFAPRGALNTGGRSPDMSTPDGNHGTHVSGIIASQGVFSLGVAPGVELYFAQVFTPDNSNSASNADTTAALESFSGGNPNPGTYPYISLPKVDVVNMSLGNNYNSAYEAAHVARNNAVVAGVMVVNSAGNNAYPTGNTTDRRNYTLGSGGVSLPISVAASQYGGNPILSYVPTVTNNAGDKGTLNFYCENGDSSLSGVFRDGAFGSLETRYVTYGPLSPPDSVYAHPRQTYTIEPLVYIAGKGYELYYACPNNVPTPGGTTGSDMTANEIEALNNLAPGSLAGKILVVNRGQAFFEYKCQALRLGAAGLIVVNRDEAVIGNLNIGAETSAKDLLIFSAPASFKRTLYDLVHGGETAYLDPGALLRAKHLAEPADFSTIGPVNETAEIKPDVIAPGWSVLSTDLNSGYVEMGGTSMSSPWVAGVAALVKQAYPNAAPAEIKARIMNTSDPDVIKPLSGRPNGLPGYYFNKDGTEISIFEQGAGFVNPKRAVYDGVCILVTNNDIPTGSTDKSTFEDAKMASFSFGPTMAGTEEDGPTVSKTLTAAVSGGTIGGVRVTYNHDSRYSNKNLDGAVEVFVNIAEDGTSFDVWLEINEWAGIDQIDGNLYEGYIFVTVNGKEFALPWATRVGEFKSPESDYWLVYPDRPVQAVRQTANQDFSPYSSQNLIFFMFEGMDIADSVELRLTSTGSGNNRRYSYYLDFYLIDWIPSGRISHRLSVLLANNQTDADLLLSDFIDIGETYFITWDGRANSINALGTVSGTLSNVPASAYNIGIPFDDGLLHFYDELGVVFTNTRPTLTVEDFTLTGGTITYHEYGYGTDEATISGRLFSAATKLAADMGFYWAGEYLFSYDVILPIDQSLNVLADAASGIELEFYNEDFGEEVPWFCDEDGYFTLTLPVNDDGYFFPEDICPSGVVYCADAFDLSHPWIGNTVYMPMLYGAMASFQWLALTVEADSEIVVTSASLNNINGTLTAEFMYQDGAIPAELDPAKLSAVLTVGGIADDALVFKGYNAETGAAAWSFKPYKVRSFTALQLEATVTYEEYWVTTSAVDTDISVHIVAAAPRAAVDKLNGNMNNLHIWVTETYSDRTTNQEYLQVMIRNNAADNYSIGPYVVYVDTKGNDQIRDCHIVVAP